MAKATLTDLRNNLDEIMVAIGKENNGEISNTAAIDVLHEKHSKLVKALTPELVNIALVKLANEVAGRKRGKPVQEGVDLFGHFRATGIPKSISLGKNRKKQTIKATFQEADLWLSAHDGRVLSEGQTRHPDFRAFIDAMRPYAVSDDDTLEAAMERRREAEAKLQGRAKEG